MTTTTTTLSFIGPAACFMVVRKNENTGLYRRAEDGKLHWKEPRLEAVFVETLPPP